jgi:hypothetical protein
VSEPDLTPNDWFVWPKCRKLYLYLTGHEPPRPFAIWIQFLQDARQWPTIGLWLYCGWAIAYGSATSQWFTVAIGAAMILFWFACLLIVASGYRTSPVAVGVIESYSWFWQFNLSKAKAVMADGRVIDVVVPTSLAKAFVFGGRRAQVLVLDDSRPGAKGYSLVLAIKPILEAPFAEGTRELRSPDAT